MGFFAVLAAEASTPDVTHFVKRCHLNLWSLPGLGFGRRLLYLDVGLQVQAGQTEVTSVQILLPFRLEEGGWPDTSRVLQDLYPAITDQTTAELVFGGPVDITQQGGEHIVKIGDYPETMKLVRVVPTSAKVVEDYAARPDSTLVDVNLHEAIPPGTSVYFRVRFRVFGSAPIWRWTRANGGAQVDFRIADVRESRFVDTERHLRKRILEIDEANVFLMAHPRLELRARSPEFKYLRALEPGVWRDYLKGASYRFGGGALLVYYWRHARKVDNASDVTSRSKDPIKADNPFRVFLDFHRPAGRPSWYLPLQAALGVLLALLLVEFGARADVQDWDPSELNLVTVLKILAGSTVVAVFGFFNRLRLWASGRFEIPRLILRRCERAVLAVGRK